MPSLQIREVPQEIYQALKKRADEDGRSLAQEALWLLRLELFARQARPFPKGLIEDLARSAKKLGRTFSDSVPLIREDREVR